MVLNFLSFCLSVKLLISPLNLNENLAEQSILVSGFPFHHCKYIVPLSFGLQNSAEKSADNIMGIPLHVVCCFLLLLFNVFICLWLLSLWFICVSVCSSLGLSCVGFLCFLYLSECFLSHIREFLAIICSDIFFRLFLCFLSFGDHYHVNVHALSYAAKNWTWLSNWTTTTEVSETVLISFHSFSFILFHIGDFHDSVFQFTYLFFYLSYSAINSF